MKNRFHALDGTIRIINPQLDIAKGCGQPSAKCDRKDWYVSFPPFPAVVMIPLTAIFGYNVNDVLFTVLNGALNCMLLFLLLEFLVRQGLSSRTRRENLVLALLFCFGTVHFSVRSGQVWFTAGSSVLPSTSGISCAIGTAGRFLRGWQSPAGWPPEHDCFCRRFLRAGVFRDGDRLRWPGFGHLLRKGLPFAAPIVVGGILLMR